ncbi:MAG: Na/Pi cotransporter family protein [Lachnospiraceae bacterium]|nr:Na/Pi cotransporter family protein [Agathobacter sp.]MDD6444657.1 Na/Pi cotransporter family protein [Lachnospiraceae bacterium]MDY4892812.1 Na/Pi cotransporter family protein [Agathobacter sp.]
MDLFGVLTMIGGLAMFLYGMNEMGDGLAKLAGGKLEKILEKLTSKRIMAVLLGVAVTAVIQSSSATTVMVVGFVNSGIMQLSQAVGIIMGANVGTTVTSWLLSLTGIEGSSFFIQLLKPSSFAPVLAAIGIIMTMTAKDNNKKKDIGNILIGFAILMFGMETMSGAVEPLAENEKFTGILTMFSNPLLGVLAGLALTAIIQSSSASVGILQALCMTGAVSYATAIPIIMGQNIGTCVTALISSIGAKRNAKRASMIHLYFNMIGTILFFVVFYSANALVGGFRILGEPANAAGIAIVHSLFNIGSLVVLYPFADKLVRLAQLTIPETPEEKPQQADEFARLDERFLEKPGFAMELCRSAAIRMAQEAREALDHALDNMREYSDDTVDKVIAMEQNVDHYEDALGTYLVKLNNCDLSQADSRTLSILLHCIGNFERISDHAVNITESVKEMHEKNMEFSPKAREEMEIFSNALHDIVDETIEAFKNHDLDMARKIEPFEQVIDSISMEVKQRHVKRVRKGKCTIELGLLLDDIITNFERVSDHCSNIAVCMIRVHEDGFDTHEYLDLVKEEKSSWFENEYYTLTDRYALPVKKKKEE